MPEAATPERRGEAAGEMPVRQRILSAAFSAFTEAGYAETSTLEIASRARVSKRELYAMVGNKQEMLVACIRERATRLQAPADLPEPRDRGTLERALAAFGTQLLRETTDPTVGSALPGQIPCTPHPSRPSGCPFAGRAASTRAGRCRRLHAGEVMVAHHGSAR